ncbi:MAG: flagellar basal body-associated FliL family protein [Treponema sp.]|jgi:flagellar FliL protein|nr:flagellar basal body-associated FliL family protein [Treponema sp.]
MSDAGDNIDLEEEGGGEAASAPKKAAGMGGLLPNLLKFIAIGLGALICIITVAVITFSVMSKGGGKAQTAVADPSSPYVGKRQEYANYTLIGQVTTRTRDKTLTNVTVEVVLQYDLNNSAAATELTARQYDLRDFVRQYFSAKSAAELAPENEARLKNEIREILNTRFLDTAKVRNVLFLKLDVMEMP